MEIPDCPTSSASALFTLRLWQDTRGETPGEVRMQVRHVLSGETRYFRAWAQVEQYLEQTLNKPNEALPEKGENDKPTCDESNGNESPNRPYIGLAD